MGMPTKADLLPSMYLHDAKPRRLYCVDATHQPDLGQELGDLSQL